MKAQELRSRIIRLENTIQTNRIGIAKMKEQRDSDGESLKASGGGSQWELEELEELDFQIANLEEATNGFEKMVLEMKQ